MSHETAQVLSVLAGNLMGSMQMSIERAMEVLQVPIEQQPDLKKMMQTTM